MAEVSNTYGPLLLGGLLAFGLSGILAVQCIVYFKLYPDDVLPMKALVTTVWLLDLTHSSFICASLWDYFITFYGSDSAIDHIPWTIAFTVVVTAALTFLVHCFFAQRIFKSSNSNWYIASPVVLLAFLRLVAACISTAEMTRLKHFSAFIKVYPGWLFTLGLTFLTFVDLVVTVFLCYFLRDIRSRMNSTIMVQVIDTLTLYTLENGSLTCIVTAISLICWLTMPTNLIFLGLHFVIGKLYANSLLASLNTRKRLREMRAQVQTWGNHSLHVLSSDHINHRSRDPFALVNPLAVYSSHSGAQKLEISVQQTIEYNTVDLEDLNRPHFVHRPAQSVTTLQWPSPPQQPQPLAY